MKYQKSYALKLFKKELGQANHFLITILVGLDGVKSGVVSKNADFDAAWNPHDVENSAGRSRVFAIKSSLAWAVDCLDMYFLLCNKKPKLLNDELSRTFDGTGHSVYNKYKAIISCYEMDEIEKACIDLLICWRNRTTHYFAENNISEETRKVLLNKICYDDNAKKCHLDEVQMLSSFDKGETPSFKEVAFLIRKTILFVTHLDEKLLNSIDTLDILDSMLCKELKDNEKQFDSIFSKKDDRRKKKMIEYIKNLGFTEEASLDINEESYIQSVTSCSYKAARECVQKGTFKSLIGTL